MIELNAVIYLLVFLLYMYYTKKFNLGGMLLAVYAISAFSSIAFYHHEYFSYSVHDSVVTLIPFIYLFTTLMLFFYPILKFREDLIEEVQEPALNKLLYLSYFIIAISMISIFIYLPLAQQGMSGDISENRTEMMAEGLTIENPVFRMISRIQVVIKEFAVLLFFYMISFRKSHKLVNTLLGISAFLPVFLFALAFSARGTIFYTILSFIVCFFIFKKFISKKIRRIIYISFASFVGVFVLIFIIITLSRFADADVDLMYWQYKYAGENFVNFNGILFDKTIGYTNGDTCFPLARRLLGLEYKQTLEEYRDMAAMKTGVPCYIFYTFIGDLYLDFGKTITFIIAVIACFLGLRYFKPGSVVPFYRIILFELFYILCVQGLFIFPFFNEEGNLLILFHILMYFYFRTDFKNRIFGKR